MSKYPNLEECAKKIWGSSYGSVSDAERFNSRILIQKSKVYWRPPVCVVLYVIVSYFHFWLKNNQGHVGLTISRDRFG
jgi:hypothetical protein